MRFVSRSANYTMIARPDAEYEVFETANGSMIPRSIKKPALILEFKHGVAHPDEVYAAKMHWAGMPTRRTDPERVDATGHSAPDVFGAVPYQRGVTIQDGVGRITGVSNASRPDFGFSLFDSEWITDKDDREIAEKALLDNVDNGDWYVKIDAISVPPPWPNYEKVRAKKGMTVAETIATKCLEDGYNPHVVLSYERAHANRAAVVEALEKIVADRDALAEEAAALEVEVV